MNFITYVPTTGEIVRSGSCQASVFGLDMGDGTLWLEVGEKDGEVSGETHHVSKGEITPYSRSELETKAAAPAHHAVWDNATMGWLDLRTLGDVKRTVKALVAAEVSRAEAGQMRSMREMLLAQATGDPLPEGAKLALAAVESTAVDVRATMQAIDAATTKEEVEAIMAGR